MRWALAVVVALAGTAAVADTVTKEDAGLRYDVPDAWVRVPAPSDMRAAQYRVPGEGGADAELVLFFFGKGRGGGVDANDSLKVTTLDLAGTYSPMPMGAGNPARARPGTRMLAVIVEGEGGPWFFRLVGPAATVGAAKAAFDAMMKSLHPHA
jgi:hypothetical protein